jgi:hypothetical protein
VCNEAGLYSNWMTICTNFVCADCECRAGFNHFRGAAKILADMRGLDPRIHADAPQTPARILLKHNRVKRRENAVDRACTGACDFQSEIRKQT